MYFQLSHCTVNKNIILQPPGITTNLWSLALVLIGIDDSLLPPEYTKGIVNLQHIIKLRSSEAWRLERNQSAAVSGRPVSAQRAAAKDERLGEAAELHMLCGNTMKYCELLTQIGDWQKALSLAPGVSIEYWRELCRRFISFTLKNGDVSQALPFAISAGVFEEVLQSFWLDHRTSDGLLLSQVAMEKLPNQNFEQSDNNSKSANHDVLESVLKYV